MPLSTSSSEQRIVARSYAKPVAFALVTIVLLLCAFEAWFRISFFRISKIESRTHSDHAAALALRQHGPKPAILLLGNSLLLEALDNDRLRTRLQATAIPTRFVIEQTAWLDWYYGIRRLFADGSRPDRIILCLNIPHLLSSNLRGDYSAFYLIQTSDLIEAGQASGYDATRISSLVFSRYSLFLAGLANFRNFVLNRVAPDYANTLRLFIRNSTPTYIDEGVLKTATERLSQLQAVCSQYHTRCDILVPPGFEPPHAAPLFEAGRRTGTTILIPVPLGSWGQDMFRDGFHVTEAAGVKFTDLLAQMLQQQ